MMKYRIKNSGTGRKWSGWRKTDKTEEEIKMMVGHPKIQAVEWKELSLLCWNNEDCGSCEQQDECPVDSEEGGMKYEQ